MQGFIIYDDIEPQCPLSSAEIVAWYKEARVNHEADYTIIQGQVTIPADCEDPFAAFLYELLKHAFGGTSIAPV